MTALNVSVREPAIVYTVPPADKFLWAVKCYIELLSKNRQPVYGSGLKTLYAMVSGAETLNTYDIDNMVCKAEKMKIIPKNLDNFRDYAIGVNISSYAQELVNRIQDRIMSISRGEVTNPDVMVTYNPASARRNYYVPPFTLIKNLKDNLRLYERTRCGMNKDFAFTDILVNICNDFDLCLYRLKGTQGTSFPSQASFTALNNCMEELLYNLSLGNPMYGSQETNGDYLVNSRSILKIFWVIAKMLYGDLSENPFEKDTNVIDLDSQINLSDGTLAAIPFPTHQTVMMFADDAPVGLTAVGRRYLTAVSACQI